MPSRKQDIEVRVAFLCRQDERSEGDFLNNNRGQTTIKWERIRVRSCVFPFLSLPKHKSDSLGHPKTFVRNSIKESIPKLKFMKTIHKKKLLFSSFMSLLCTFTSVTWADLTQNKSTYSQGNYIEASKNLKPLAEAGDPEAQTLLGTMYLNGQGIEESSTEAYVWYSRAAHQGNTEAQIALSDMYRMGNGVEKNALLAAYWRSLAADSFSQAAKNELLSEISKTKPATIIVTGLPNISGGAPATATAKKAGCKPEYPAEALRNRVEGVAFLGGYITPTGEIENPIVLQSSGSEVLDQSAKSFIKLCKFTQGTLDGVPVRSFVNFKQIWKIDKP
jgi:TonB family protein